MAGINECTIFRKFKGKKEIIEAAMSLTEWNPCLKESDFEYTGKLMKDLCSFAEVYSKKKSLDVLQKIRGIKFYCPAWDDVYDKNKLDTVITNSKIMLARLKDAVCQVENEFSQSSESEKMQEVYKRADMLKFIGNPLVSKSIEACQRMCK